MNYNLNFGDKTLFLKSNSQAQVKIPAMYFQHSNKTAKQLERETTESLHTRFQFSGKHRT